MVRPQVIKVLKQLYNLWTCSLQRFTNTEVYPPPFPPLMPQVYILFINIYIQYNHHSNNQVYIGKHVVTEQTQPINVCPVLISLTIILVAQPLLGRRLLLYDLGYENHEKLNINKSNVTYLPLFSFD